MKETLKYNKEIEFENSISEIASISLECTYNEEDRGATGVFLVEGNYKSFELFDDEDFRYELPFEKSIDNLKENSLNIEINDFTYEINANKLIVDIDYTISYEENDYLDEEELNRFLEEHEVDVISFKEESDENAEEVVEEDIDSRITEEIPDTQEDESTENTIVEPILEKEEINEVPPQMPINEENIIEDNTEEERLLEDTILNNINQEEKYITYHVYVCESEDTIESVATKYNLSINEIIEYNNVEELTSGMKLILPAKDEN